MNPARKHGLTALEVLTLLAIAALVAVAWLTFSSGATARYAEPPAADRAVREQARRALNEMADELRLAKEPSIVIENQSGGSRVTFQTASGGSVVYAVEPSPASARLVRIQDGQRTTLVDGLRPGGFSAKKAASVLTLVLSPGYEAPLQTAIALRAGL